nr:hypothetical protein [Rhodococcus sp. 15-1154-1]
MAKAKTVEITDRVERMEALEDRAGISLEGLYVVHVKDYRNEVRVNFDVISPTGEIRNSVKVMIAIYNAKMQQIGTDYVHIDSDRFAGLESCSETIECEEPPARIRIYPAIRN